MIKNLTTNQILLIILATALLLLAAFSFYLLQDPSAPLPFAPPPATSTITPQTPLPTRTSAPTATSTPTRRTSYTPFAPTATIDMGTPPEFPNTTGTGTPLPSGTTTPLLSTLTSTLQSQTTTTRTFTPTLGTAVATRTVTPTSGTATTTRTITPTSSTATVTPTASQTLSTGEFEVKGRVVRNGTPVANVVVEFADDVAPRQATTGSGGHYSFTTLAPGTNFSLTFKQADNTQLTPAAEIASQAWIEGSLPTGIDVIQLPDLEVSLNLEGLFYELESPADGTTYSAAAISQSNPRQFNWSVYNEIESYYVELGLSGSDIPLWTSGGTTSTNMMWNGTLDSGDHITEGAYWWQVAATGPLGNYSLIVLTHTWDIIFNP